MTPLFRQAARDATFTGIGIEPCSDLDLLVEPTEQTTLLYIGEIHTGFAARHSEIARGGVSRHT